MSDPARTTIPQSPTISRARRSAAAVIAQYVQDLAAAQPPPSWTALTTSRTTETTR